MNSIWNVPVFNIKISLNMSTFTQFSCSPHFFTKNEFRISADLHVKSNEVIVKETMHAAAVEQISHMEQQSQISQVSPK